MKASLIISFLKTAQKNAVLLKHLRKTRFLKMPRSNVEKCGAMQNDFQ